MTRVNLCGVVGPSEFVQVIPLCINVKCVDLKATELSQWE